MGQDTNISWCDHTWNPWRGCTKVSPGCTNCYAETMSARNPKVLGEWGPQGTRIVAAESYWKQPLKWDREAKAAGVRRKVFCASLADVFEGPETMPAESWKLVDHRARPRLWATIWCTPNLDWLLLTKRPENIVGPRHHIWAPGATANAVGWVRSIAGDEEAQRFYSSDWPSPNVWVGVSVENQQYADERIPHLLRVPAAVRFVSYEPALGPVDLRNLVIPRRYGTGLLDAFTLDFKTHHQEVIAGPPSGHGPVNWVIAGGESGSNHRACDPAWIADVARQCQEAGVACWVKQDSGTRPGQRGRLPLEVWQRKEFPGGAA